VGEISRRIGSDPLAWGWSSTRPTVRQGTSRLLGLLPATELRSRLADHQGHGALGQSTLEQTR
jgi:hypothetical protein